MAVLDIINGPDANRSCCVDSDSFSIGTDDTNEIAVADGSVATRHASIVREGMQYILTDLDSGGGTLVNGHRVKRVPLQVGDKITLGETVLRFSDDGMTNDDDVVMLEVVEELLLSASGQVPEVAEVVEEPPETVVVVESPEPPVIVEESPETPVIVEEVPETPVIVEEVPEVPVVMEEVPPVAEPVQPVARGTVPETPVAEPSAQGSVAGWDLPGDAGAPPVAEPVSPRPAKTRTEPSAAPAPGVQQRRVPFRRALLKRITCPSCWEIFQPEKIWFISQHPELIGDKVAGKSEFRRFQPVRFDLNGEAVDERGLATTQLACPRCHLQLPDCALEVPCLFTSIVGSPASGKTYFLTAMTWELRQTLPRFSLAFSDADPVANSFIHSYESALFLNPKPKEPTELRKTQADDPLLHQTVMLNDIETRLPRPLQFCLRPTREHVKYVRQRAGRTVVLYDNAGEDYLPQHEAAGAAAVKHLGKSQIILLLFDPTQDPRFRGRCHSEDPQIVGGLRPDGTGSALQYTQEHIVNAMAVRLRRFLHLAQDQTIRQPIIVIVPKFDIWEDMVDVSIETEPFVRNGEGSFRLDIERVERTSEVLRKLFRQLCPDFMATVEGLSSVVRFIPVSSLGHSPVVTQQEGYTFYGVIPEQMKPRWVTVPLLYCLCRWGKGTVEAAAAP